MLLLAGATATYAQTTATDFTALDCNGTSHTLFSELDNGKVVVLAWVMPCSACEGPAKTAYDAAQTFATSHPGQVLFYLIDDYGDNNCADLSSWVSSQNIGHTSNMVVFENAGMEIDMNDYGTPGMPKVAVVGGTDHKIYFNKNNSSANDAAGITSAIQSALNPTSVGELANDLKFNVSPNPAIGALTISLSTPVREVVISTINGQVVKHETYDQGRVNPVVDITGLASGNYLIRLKDVNNAQGLQQVVKQ